MARVLAGLVLFLAALQAVSGGRIQQAAAAQASGHAVAAPPAPLLTRGAEDAELGRSFPRGTGTVVGDGYIGCLEMGFSRCFADPTLICVEDAMVECSLQTAAAPAAATTKGPAAPPLAAELVLGTVGGVIGHGIATVGAKYINCLEDGLPKCFFDPTIECVEKIMGAC